MERDQYHLNRTFNRTFKTPIVLIKTPPGMRNEYGEFVDGEPTRHILNAAVLGAERDRELLASGTETAETIRFYVPLTSDQIVETTGTDKRADKIDFKGKIYTIISVENWNKVYQLATGILQE